MRSLSPDRFIALLIFLVVSSVYFSTLSGVTSSNDGSHYALVRALVDRHSFEISPYLDFTEHQDYALDGDYRYSDRPPGTALMAAPLYSLAVLAPTPIVTVPSKHDPQNRRLLYAVIAAPLFAAASVTLFYLALRHQFQRSLLASLFTVTALAFGTTTWKYGSVLYSHAVAGLVVWAGILLALQAHKSLPSKTAAFVFGITIGFAPLVEYTNVLVTAFVGIDWLISLWRSSNGRSSYWVSRLGLAAVGAAIPITFLMIYNTMNFGGPFELSTFHVDTNIWPQNAGLAADFATPLFRGLKGMLFWGDANQGLVVLSPITILSLLGLFLFWRHSRRAFILVIGLFTMMLLVISKSTTFNPLTNDGRYLTPFVGLWLVPLAFWLDHALSKKAKNQISFTGLVLYGLLLFSIRNQLMHIAFSWNYDLDPAKLAPIAVSPQNIAYILKTVFPDTGNLPLLWWLLLVFGGLFGIAWQWQKHQRKKKTIFGLQEGIS